jgi:hypothetical protein
MDQSWNEGGKVRIFVTGTGRCGTVTFTKACSHIENFTSAHESHSGEVGNWKYPTNHIEVDPRLAYSTAVLSDLYPDALIIHLVRDKSTAITSLAKRTSINKFRDFHFGSSNCKDMNKIANVYYDTTNTMLRKVLKLHKNTCEYSLEKMKAIHWEQFWKSIGAEGNFRKSLQEWDVKHNRSK